MKGIFELRPPQPRLFTTWSVMTVLKYLKSLSPPEGLSLKQLTLKVVMLSALVSAARCSFLHQMDLNFSYFRNDMIDDGRWPRPWRTLSNLSVVQ